MPDVYYDSTLTGQELDEALRSIPADVTRAGTAAAEAEKNAKAAESWARGGTETREGEDADNAEYWAKQAKTDAETASAGVRVVTENLEDIQAIGENLEAIQNAPNAAERAETAAKNAAADAARAEEAAGRARSISQGALGYYSTADGLKAAHKTGENGEWAIVGETDTIWVWDSDSGSWTDSGSKTDLSQYYTKEETDTALDGLQRTVDTALSETVQTLTETVETAKQEALGAALYLYSAALTVEGWESSEDAGYAQTAACTPEKAGPAVTAATQLGIPMTRPTGGQEADEAMQAALGIINSGTVTPGEGTVTVKAWEKPETEITVYWYGRPGEGGGFVSGGSGGSPDIILRAKGMDGTPVEATLNGKTFKDTIGPEGFVDIKLKELGSYSLKITFMGISSTQTVNVYQYGITECWALGNKPFEECTPEEIAEICRSGMYSKYWQRGDKVKIEMKDGEEIYVVIADFDHDVRTDGKSTIPLTLVMENCFKKISRMNAENNNTGSWERSEFRNITLPGILSNFPDEWQEVMTSCQKNTAGCSPTEDTLWLLSEIEFFGSVTYSLAGEGKGYPIFTDNNSRKKTVAGAADSVFTRSPDKRSYMNFCVVTADGMPDGSYAANPHGICLGFCVG